MTEPKYLIWSNYSLDYEDWREDLEAEYPELSEQEREEKMYERNGEYLDDERMNLDIQLDKPILVIVDLGLWNGRYSGYMRMLPNCGTSTNSRQKRKSHARLVGLIWAAIRCAGSSKKYPTFEFMAR